MKANELRIGNYVNICYSTRKKIAKEVKLMQIENIHEKGVNIGATSFGDITVRAIYDYKEPPMGSNYDPENFLSPIPLDEEWLVKFGFDIERNPEEVIYTKRFDVLDIYKIEIKRKVGYDIFYFKTDDLHKQVLKVHQLQNLYFALTGEELTIKTK